MAKHNMKKWYYRELQWTTKGYKSALGFQNRNKKNGKIVWWGVKKLLMFYKK